MRVVLHQSEVSPFCAKVRKILRFKGIAFEVENYHGAKARRARRLSNAGTLPVLDWGAQRLDDGARIAAFVEQQVPWPPLLPADPREAALVRTLEDWADSALYQQGLYLRTEYAAPRAAMLDLLCAGRPGWERAVFGAAGIRAFRRRLDALGFGRRDGPGIEAAFLRRMDDLDLMLRDRDWLVGQARSLADIAISAQLEAVIRTSTLAERIGARPRLARWLVREQAL